MPFQTVKGMRDFDPETMRSRNVLFSSLRAAAERYTFSEVETPAMEYLDVLTKKSGDEIKDQIFVLEKKSKEQLGLRFDLTVPLTRMFIEKQKALPKPVKWFGCSRMWRYEAPQKGRLREFYQLSVECFGATGAMADAEILSLGISFLEELGLTSSDVVIKINNRKLMYALLTGFGIDEKERDNVLAVIDKKMKVSDADFLDMLSFLDDEVREKVIMLCNADLESLRSLATDEQSKEALLEVESVFTLLESKKDFLQFDPSVVRGLAYYTGMVFECFDKDGKFRALFGGGRYDNMVSLLGGEDCPATGFAIGDVTLELLLREKNLWPSGEKKVDYYLASLGTTADTKALELASVLRKKYVVEVNVMQKKMGKQFQYADSLGAKHVIVIGDNELSSGKAKVKDMESGEEKEVTFEVILTF